MAKEKSTTPKEQSDKNKEAAKTKQFKFPSNLGSHQMIIKFYEYNYSAIKKGSSDYGVKASIALPLPQNIVESSRLEVGGSQIGVIGAATADIAGASMGGDIIENIKSDASSAKEGATGFDAASVLDRVKQDIGGAVAAGGNLAVYLAKVAGSKISPQAGQALSASAGSAVNNQTTLIFDGVDLKIHNFEWLFSPKNLKESQELDDIIRLINFYIHPSYANPVPGIESDTFSNTLNRGLLKYPAMISIELKSVSGGLAKVFRTGKFLMVNQFNVDYTPQGMVLNKGGTASVIRCSMNTTETDIRTRADFAEGLPGTTGTDAATDKDSESTDDGQTDEGVIPAGDGEQADAVTENKAEEESPEADDTAPAYKQKVGGTGIPGQGSRSVKKYNIYTKDGKIVERNVSAGNSSKYPVKESYFKNLPVDR
jgi:hypothetical protein